eukprot:CFRG4101T1
MAVLMAGGGLVGFLKKRSVPSLIAGFTFAGLYGYSSYLISTNEEIGHDLAAAASTILTLSMSRRALKSGKFMPAGMVATLGLAAGAYNGYKAADYRGFV